VANRSYLYAFDRLEARTPQKPRGLHEWNWTIPPTHLMLMSGTPRWVKSVAVPERNVAIVADREPGVARLLAFLRALETNGELGDGFVEDARTAETFLASEQGAGPLLLLEPFELFAMMDRSWEWQCAQVVQKQIPAFAAKVDELIARPPERLFENAPTWLAEVRESWNMKLGLGDWGPIIWLRLD
jgi:hypothetical protein